jgi:hypothetical protein
MNVAKAYELALATVIREFADVGSGFVFRCWQTLRSDPAWRVSSGADRTRFTVDLRAAPPVSDEGPSNRAVTAIIEARAKTEDDQDHAKISKAYDAIQEVVDKLHDQFYSTAGDELTRFLELMEAECGTAFGFGGLTFADGTAPYDDDGYSVIGIGLTAHYSRRN